MKIQVELSAPQTIQGIKDLAEQWEAQFPSATLARCTAYGTLRLQLEMPAATRVVLPQIVDARSHEVSE